MKTWSRRTTFAWGLFHGTSIGFLLFVGVDDALESDWKGLAMDLLGIALLAVYHAGSFVQLGDEP